MDFTNKVVLITGASSGIGASTAIYFAKHSAKLALVGRNEKNLLQTAAACEKEKSIKPLTILADITIEADVERIVKETMAHFEQLDVLINNSGISQYSTIKTFSLESYDIIMNTNLRGTVYLTSLAIPHLIKSKGNIVCVSSMTSTKTVPLLLVYSMSKAALDHFTKSLAIELGPDSVRVNNVNPGIVKTAILKRMGIPDDQVEQKLAQHIKNIPLRKLTEATDVAELIVFLASDLAKSITGGIHQVSGGLHL